MSKQGVYVSGHGPLTVYRAPAPMPDSADMANAAVNARLAWRREDRRLRRSPFRAPLRHAIPWAEVKAALRVHPRTALPGETDAEGKPTQRYRERMNAAKRARRAR